MSLKVLVADDDCLMRTFVSVSLAGFADAEVTEAADGDEALALFEQDDFDLVLLDWDMPGKNGLEIIKAIRGRGCRVPVIMVTAHAEREQVVTALQSGASDYLIKPFRSEALREKLKKFFPQER
ncbi:MAG TPA: response regulator [Thermoguttaceae bacterium]|nr:response regulator [Thermoguttaceae bacterium]